MPISAKPIVIPAKTLDKLWIQMLSVNAGQPGGQAWFNSTLVPYNADGDVGDPIVLDPLDVFAEVANDPEAAEIMEKFMAYIARKAIEQGKIEPADVE